MIFPYKTSDSSTVVWSSKMATSASDGVESGQEMISGRVVVEVVPSVPVVVCWTVPIWQRVPTISSTVVKVTLGVAFVLGVGRVAGISPDVLLP